MKNVPILFLIFNRPEVTFKVFKAISAFKPKQLFIAADGPRLNVPSDHFNCEKTRQVIDLIDWECDLKVLFRDENLGCANAVKDSITWFFNQVDRGIIFEDDCLPSPLFYEFCSELLERYKDNDRIMHIGGNNFQVASNSMNTQYYYSQIPHIWGWATWRRAWTKYNHDFIGLKQFLQTNLELKISSDLDVRNYWTDCFYYAFNGKVNSWAYRWCFSILSNQGICITPNENLVENIGFGEDSTHTKEGYCPKLTQMNRSVFKSLTHPSLFEIDRHKDEFTYEALYNVKKNSYLYKKRSYLFALIKRLKSRMKSKKRLKELLLKCY
ncbi:MAG: nucleotide-diphospho-sugar transferase [Coraliomargaritaceae bacterium]